MKLTRGLILGIFLFTLVFSQSKALAFNSSSFNGTADFYAGAAPPPGLHLIDYNVYMDIRKVENKGQGLTDGKGTLTALAFRPIYVSEKGLLGGNLLLHSIIPLLTVEANVTAQTPGGPIKVEGHDGGLGDIYFGVGMAFHHHMGTVVQTEAEIDRLMAMTGDDVGLLLDTGHLAFAGGDPAAVAPRHGRRIVHVHCKDVRPDVMRSALAKDSSFLASVLVGVLIGFAVRLVRRSRRSSGT